MRARARRCEANVTWDTAMQMHCSSTQTHCSSLRLWPKNRSSTATKYGARDLPRVNVPGSTISKQ